MTSPSSPEVSGLIERLTQAKTWQREDLTALCFEAASALSAYEGRLEEARELWKGACDLAAEDTIEANAARRALEARLETARKALEAAQHRFVSAARLLRDVHAAAGLVPALNGAADDLSAALSALEQSGEGLGASRANSGGTAQEPKSDSALGLGRSRLPPLGYYCPACEAIPQAGYCRLAGCPTAPKSDSAEGH